MIQYGAPDHYVEVTPSVPIREGCYCIPASDTERVKLFGNPTPEVDKHIRVTFPDGQESIYSAGTPARISTTYTQSNPYRYYLSIVTVTQCDARFLREWIEFHLLVGVEHFYIYDNESPDNTCEVLMPYIRKGVITYVLWESTDPAVMSGRNAGLKRAKLESQWVASIDTDEFIVPNKVDDLPTLLRPYEGYGALLVNWQMFGSNQVEEIPKDKLMIECLTKSLHPTADAEIEWVPGSRLAVNKHVKCILNSTYVLTLPHGHVATYSGSYPVNSRFEHQKGPFMPICIEDIQLNHYFFRDLRFAREVKLERRNRYMRAYGLKDETLQMYAQTDEDCCSTVNLSAQRFVEPLRKRMFEI